MFDKNKQVLYVQYSNHICVYMIFAGSIDLWLRIICRSTEYKQHKIICQWCASQSKQWRQMQLQKMYIVPELTCCVYVYQFFSTFLPFANRPLGPQEATNWAWKTIFCSDNLFLNILSLSFSFASPSGLPTNIFLTFCLLICFKKEK